MRSTNGDKCPMLAEEGGHSESIAVGSSDRKLKEQPRVVLMMYVPAEEQHFCGRTESVAVGSSDRKLKEQPRVVIQHTKIHSELIAKMRSTNGDKCPMLAEEGGRTESIAVGSSDRELKEQPRVVLTMNVPAEEQNFCGRTESVAMGSSDRKLKEQPRVVIQHTQIHSELIAKMRSTNGDKCPMLAEEGGRTESIAVGSSDRELKEQPRVVLTMNVPAEEHNFCGRTESVAVGSSDRKLKEQPRVVIQHTQIHSELIAKMTSTNGDKCPMLAEEGGRTESIAVGSSVRELKEQPRVVLTMNVPAEEQNFCGRTESVAVGSSDRKLKEQPTQIHSELLAKMRSTNGDKCPMLAEEGGRTESIAVGSSVRELKEQPRVVLTMNVPAEEQNFYQCVDSSLQVKMSSPAPTSTKRQRRLPQYFQDFELGGRTESIDESTDALPVGSHSCGVNAPTPRHRSNGRLQAAAGSASVDSSIAVGSSDRKLKEQPRVVLATYVPAEEQYFYCQPCKQFFLIQCEKHGLPVFRAGPTVALGETGRARKTLPAGFEIKGSRIPKAGLGVFYCGDTELPAGIHFGPYEGVKTGREEAVESGYSWVIHKRTKCYDYIDGKDETQSNWMRYVNCARNLEEQNLVAVQYRGGVVYRCCRPVARGEELLVWYGDEYAKELGIIFDKLWDKKSSAKGVKSQSPKTQVFSCTECPYAFTSQDFLRNHMKRSHYDLHCQISSSAARQKQGDASSSKRFTKTLPQQGELKTPQATRGGKKPHVCNRCDKSYSHLKNLTTHQVTCTGKEPVYVCNHCDKSFGQLSNLKRHLLVHSGERPFLCEQCAKGFCQLIDLQKHQRVHAGKKHFCCKRCDKSFTFSSDLQRHQSVHTGAKPFYCTQCDKSFNRLDTLNRHQRVHAEERQFHCQLCDQGFSKMYSLKRHQRLLHTGERLFGCKLCGKGFSHSRDLQKHQRVHTRPRYFPCTLCDKSFIDFKTLKKHQLVHTGEKPFHCDQCDKSFSLMYNYRRHQWVHTEPRKKNHTQCEESGAFELV